MSCKYCNRTESIVCSRTQISCKGAHLPGIDVFIDDDEMSIIAVSDTYEPSYQEECVNINFCPMCGEKLKKE